MLHIQSVSFPSSLGLMILFVFLSGQLSSPAFKLLKAPGFQGKKRETNSITDTRSDFKLKKKYYFNKNFCNEKVMKKENHGVGSSNKNKANRKCFGHSETETLYSHLI